MRTLKHTWLQQVLTALKNGTKRYGAVAAGISVVGMMGEARATLLPIIPPATFTAPLDSDGGLFAANGVMEGNLTSPFSVSNSGTTITGTIETYVVRRSLDNPDQDNTFMATPGLPLGPGSFESDYTSGGLDFYYQIKLDASSSANADIRAVTLSIFDPTNVYGSGEISAFVIETLTNVPPEFDGTADNPETLGTQKALLVSRDNAGVKFDFRDTTDDNSLMNLPGQRESNWLVLRTNATTFQIGNGALIDGIAFNAPILAPGIPEPSTALFGLALLGVATIRRGRKGTRELA